MSKRIETSIIINKPLDTVWQEVKVMENHVNWMEDAVKIDIRRLLLNDKKFWN